MSGKDSASNSSGMTQVYLTRTHIFHSCFLIDGAYRSSVGSIPEISADANMNAVKAWKPYFLVRVDEGVSVEKMN